MRVVALRFFTPFALAGLLLAPAYPSFAQSTSGSNAPMTVTLTPQNNSGESGTATITPSGDGVVVKIDLKGEPSGVAQPAHIHTGTCANLGGVYKPLTSVSNGQSTTTISGLTTADLMKGTYAINVHKSASEIQTYVACGNISTAKM
jgi:hypothetical protein